MSKSEWSKKQELAKRLVDEHVIRNVSVLVGKFSEAFPEEIEDLCESCDYESAAQAYIEDCDDIDELEQIADGVGYWDECQKEIGFDPENPPKRPDTSYADKVCVECHFELQGLGYEDMSEERAKEVQEAVAEFDGGEYLGEEYDEEFSKRYCDCCGSHLAGVRFSYEKPEDFDTLGFEEWLDEDVKRWDALRSVIAKDVSGGDAKWVCDEFQVDMDDYRNEVYECWLVSDWIADKLKERGELVGDLYGLTVWCRTCSGQAIYLDDTWERLGIEIYADEWNEFLANKEPE